MHKFLRSIGFSTYRKKRDIEKLLASLIPSAKWRRIQLDEETNLCELRAEVAPGMGIVMMGEMDEEAFEKLILAYDYSTKRHSKYQTLEEEPAMIENGKYRYPDLKFIPRGR